MRTLFATLSMLVFSLSINAQDIQTYYYSKDGKAVNQVFADYYRVISVPSDSNSDKLFRDFYMSGKVKGEGRYISIDTANANNSVLDGECVFYREDGSIDKKFTMNEGKLNGTYIQFSSDGNEFIQIDYANGEHANDWYYKANTTGAYGRFKHNTNEPIYDEFNPEAQFTTWVDGIPWVSYTVNGLTISMAIQKSDSYGRYHEVSIMIDNTTFSDIIIEPTISVSANAAMTASRLITNPEKRDVLSYDDYMQKVQNRQAWAAVAMAVSSAAAGVNSAFSPNSVSVSLNGHSAYINSYGNHISVFSPDLAYAGVGEAWAQHREVTQKGYLKKNTVNSGSIISGKFNIMRKDFGYLEVIYNYNGIKIPFYWDVTKETANPISYDLVHPKKISSPSERELKELSSSEYKWQTKYATKVESIKVKKNTKITVVDTYRTMNGHKFVIVDANGEHATTYTTANVFDVVFTVETTNLQFPFSIVCKDNDDYSLLNVDKVL